VDADLPAGCDAVLAIGDVLGYRFDPRNDDAALDRLFARAAEALRPGRLVLFDLPGRGRLPTGGNRTWHEGQGWAVLVQATASAGELHRHVTTFRDMGAGCFRRSAETHRLRLHPPAATMARLRAAGFTARALPRGSAGEALPPGLTAYVGAPRSVGRTAMRGLLFLAFLIWLLEWAGGAV
jgi:hypothetical protein